MLENSSILITGGTGSFGNTFVPMTLEKYNPRRLVIFSRDEMKQWEMAKHYESDSRISFVIGDIRDRSRLDSIMTDVDYVIHAAATKIVPLAEYNPDECVKTNINGTTNLIDICKKHNVKKVVALSTDKACNPVNLYGATKLAADKLFIAANSYDLSVDATKFSIVRYGNVIGSRGSVIPFFLSKKESSFLPITDNRMTRFMITLEEAVELVWQAFDDMCGGEIYVKKIPSMNIIDIAKAVSKTIELREIGIRPGEKIHEQMITTEDSSFTYEYKGYFKILPAIHNCFENIEWIGNGKKVKSNFSYTSDNNTDWMSIEQLENWININKSIIGKF